MIALRVLQIGSACCIPSAMVVLNAVAYNPMSANWSRLQSISDELGSAALIGLSGTARKHQAEFGPCRISRLNRFTLYDWCWASKTAGINKACGVALLCRRDALPRGGTSHVYSPPPALQGRGGAVRHKLGHTELCTMCLYMAPNTAPCYDKINRKLFEWANKIKSMLPTRCNFILLIDANANFGLPPPGIETLPFIGNWSHREKTQMESSFASS